jgi:hypothetical protein
MSMTDISLIYLHITSLRRCAGSNQRNGGVKNKKRRTVKRDETGRFSLLLRKVFHLPLVFRFLVDCHDGMHPQGHPILF